MPLGTIPLQQVSQVDISVIRPYETDMRVQPPAEPAQPLPVMPS